MFPPRPIWPYYFQADLILWDGPFRYQTVVTSSTLRFLNSNFPYNAANPYLSYYVKCEVLRYMYTTPQTNCLDETERKKLK